MLEVRVEDTRVVAVDRANRTFEVDVVGLDRPAPAPELPIEVDATLDARATSLTFEPALVNFKPLDGEYRKLSDAKETRDVPDGEYVLKVNDDVVGYVRFDGPATLQRSSDGTACLSFDHPKPIRLGFWSLVDYPEDTVTVPKTPSGVATALSYLSASHLLDSPDRTLPGWREHPPRVAFGEEEVPSAVRAARPETGIELVLPPSYDHLFPAAPLAHYLAADVTVEADATPRLLAADADVDHEIAGAFQYAANDLFERVFYCDCLVRTAGPIGDSDLSERDLLDDLSLDAAACYEATPAERLARYLDGWATADADDSTGGGLPSRNYVAYVEPTPENASALPFLCKYLATVYLPDAYERTARPADETRLEAWLAPGTRPETFETTPAAYDHRLAHLTADRGDDRVVVAGTRARTDRIEAVAGWYEAFADDDLSVETLVDPGSADLARAFDATTDVAHYVGDCDGGLVCADGALDAATLDGPTARLFVLDAPGTRTQGRSLVGNGSVAGAVCDGSTPTDAFVRPFVRLLVQGFGVDLARRFVDHHVGGGSDVAVVGDGTYPLDEDDTVNVLPMAVAAVGDGTFSVTALPGGPTAGLAWHPDVDGPDARLLGNRRPVSVTGVELRRLLDTTGYVVVYEDALYWSEELEPFYPVA